MSRGDVFAGRALKGRVPLDRARRAFGWDRGLRRQALLSVVWTALHGMPEGEPPGLGRVPDRKPHMFGFVPYIARDRAQAMSDVPGIVCETGRCGRTRRGECPENDTKEGQPARHAARTLQSAASRV